MGLSGLGAGISVCLRVCVRPRSLLQSSASCFLTLWGFSVPPPHPPNPRCHAVGLPSCLLWASLRSGGLGEERWDAREALLHVSHPQEDLEQDQQEAGGGLGPRPTLPGDFRVVCWAAGSEPSAHRADLKSYTFTPPSCPTHHPVTTRRDLGHHLPMPRASRSFLGTSPSLFHPTSQDENPGGASYYPMWGLCAKSALWFLPLLRQDSICVCNSGGCNKATVTCVCSGQDARTLSPG